MFHFQQLYIGVSQFLGMKSSQAESNMKNNPGFVQSAAKDLTHAQQSNKHLLQKSSQCEHTQFSSSLSQHCRRRELIK